MRVPGVVVSVEGELARVRVAASAGCGGGCCACSSAATCTQEIEAVASEPVEEGARVIVEMRSGAPGVSALLLFVLPLAGLLGGILAGERWPAIGAGGNAGGLVLGLGLMAGLFALACVVDRLVVRPRLPQPRIVEILNEGARATP